MRPAKLKKKTAATTRSSRRGGPLRLQIEVLQGGASLLSLQLPLRRRGTLALTTHGEGPLTLPHYPLPDGRLEFISFSRAGAALVVEHDWEGFCTSKGELLTLGRGSSGRRLIPLTPGDYASITEGDLRLMLKLAPLAEVSRSGRRGIGSGYRRSFIRHFFPTTNDLQLTVVGALAAAVVIGGATLGLLGRNYQRPTQMSDIGIDYILPFIAPAHLQSAPEALQQHLDRQHPVQAVMAYYHSFTAALMGWQHYDRSELFDSTTQLYEQLHAEAKRTLVAKIAQQEEIDRLQQMKSGAGLLTIPSVQGESSDGSMQRVIDKIAIMQSGLEQDLVAKRAMTETFPRDPDYAWEEYKNTRGLSDTNAKTSQIRVFSQATDEEMMYDEATALAKRAALKQRRILRHRQDEPAEGAAAAAVAPVGIGAGLRYASFAAAVDYTLADEKLTRLAGSEYGQRKTSAPKIQEPLVGEIEPALIERFLRENRFQLQLCYELALRRNEAAAGTMEWRWRIDSRGLISDIALLTSSIKDPRMTECVRQKISAWRFPRPRRGSVEISYPFEFAPSKG